VGNVNAEAPDFLGKVNFNVPNANQQVFSITNVQ